MKTLKSILITLLAVLVLAPAAGAAERHHRPCPDGIDVCPSRERPGMIFVWNAFGGNRWYLVGSDFFLFH